MKYHPQSIFQVYWDRNLATYTHNFQIPFQPLYEKLVKKQNEPSLLLRKRSDQKWMLGSIQKEDQTDSQATNAVNQVNEGSQKGKYEEKTKSYTTYLIGRRFSQNTASNTQEEIKKQKFKKKKSCRLTHFGKMGQQLEEKFKDNCYNSIKHDIKMQDLKHISPTTQWAKRTLTEFSLKEKSLAYKAQIDSNSYNHQSQCLLKYSQQEGVTWIPKFEQALGKFAIQTVNNIHSYITLYLNRLIHGLLTVSKSFIEPYTCYRQEKWPAPPNLITFKNGDLLRCKMSSKEKEIIKIFRQIKQISNTKPEKMKILRTKNRLKQGTNDILINVKFDNLIACEIQLEVINNSMTQFIKCSNTFSHYIYELKRSIFGPVSQLYNIWNNFQSRAQEYDAF